MMIRQTLLCLLLPVIVSAQDLHVRGVRINENGRATAIVTRFERGSSAALPIAETDVAIEVDGKSTPVVWTRCNEQRTPDAMSSVLTIDVSGSMSRGGPNIALAKVAATAWVRALQGRFECAITSFDHSATLLADFTSDTNKLLASINKLTPRGGTDYDAGLLTDEIGGIPLAATGKYRRVVVFLTDGIGQSSLERMVAEASAGGVTVFAVTVGMAMPESLKHLCATSGGLWFDNVTTVQQAEQAYNRIYQSASYQPSCTVEFDVPPGCSDVRTVSIRVGSDTIRTTLHMPQNSTLIPTVFPPALRFESNTFSKNFTIRSGTDTLLVSNIAAIGITPISLSQDGNELRYPIVIAPKDSAVIVVTVTPADTTFTVSRIEITSNQCPLPIVYVSTGSLATAPVQRSIRVVSPNGGERIAAGSKTKLSYTGVPPNLPVQLDVSTNLGASWIVANQEATGFSSMWRTPLVNSDSCLLRASQVIPEALRRIPKFQIRGIRIEQWGYVGSGNYMAGALLYRKTPQDVVDSVVVIYRAADGSELHRFPGIQFAEVLAGTAIVTWNLRGVVACYNVESGQRLWGFNLPPSSRLHTIVASANGGRLLVVPHESQSPTVVNAVTGEVVQKLPERPYDPRSTAISATGSFVALCGAQDTIHIYDATTGTIRHSLTIAGVARFYRMAFSPDEKWLVATASNGTAVAWEVATGTLKHSIARRQYVNDNNYIAFLPDSRSVVLETGSDQAAIVDLLSGENVVTLQRSRSDGGIQTATPSRDGSRIALSSLGRVTIHEAVSGAMIHELRQVEYLPSFSPDAQQIALRTDEGVAGVYSVVPAILQADTSDAAWSLYRTAAKLRDVRFSPTPVGSSVDSVVQAAIVNAGRDTLIVENLRIEGADRRNFDIRTTPGFRIFPRDSVRVEFAFTPRVMGERTAVIVADVSGSTLKARISGPARGNILTAEADLLNCGTIDVGTTRELDTWGLIKNEGKDSVRIRSITVVDDADGAFSLHSPTTFTVAPGKGAELIIRFAAIREGRMTARLRFDIDGITDPAYAILYGRGAVDTFRVAKTDPTTHRGILLPTSIIPPKGTITTGVYDVAGLVAGYSVTDNLMVMAGGIIPIRNEWFSNTATPASNTAWSVGAKGGYNVRENLTVGGGYQFGQSTYDIDSTSDVDSRITFNALWASVGFGTDDSRWNVHLGYAFKHHSRPYEGSFDADATIFGIGYDYRFAYSWKICAEAFFMRTMPVVPVTLTARYFDKDQAFDFGFTITGIPASGAQSSPFPVIPVVSWVRRW